MGWTVRRTPWDGIHFIDGAISAYSAALDEFVAIGEGDALTSLDGASWGATTLPFQPRFWFGGVLGLNDAAPRFVVGSEVGSPAVGHAVWTSDDASAWTPRTSPVDGDTNHFLSPFGTAYSPALSRWVIGLNRGLTGSHTLIFTSDDDGVTWTARSSAWDAHSGEISSITWSPTLNLFVAAGVSSAGGGAGDVVMSSPDGITWTTHDSPFDGGFADTVVWSAIFAKFLLGGEDEAANNCMMESADGATWTLVTNDPFAVPTEPQFSECIAICEHQGAVWAAGYTNDSSGPCVFRSFDLSTWEDMDLNGALVGSGGPEVYSLASDGVTLVAIGDFDDTGFHHVATWNPDATVTPVVGDVTEVIDSDARPGFALGLGTQCGAPDDDYYCEIGGSIGGGDQRGGLCFGVSDLADDYCAPGYAYNISFFEPGACTDWTPFDGGGDQVTGPGAILSENGDTNLQLWQGSVRPVCYSGEYEAFGGEFACALPGAILSGGNKCKAVTGTFDLNATTGDQSVTGLGFQPQLLIFIGCQPIPPVGNVTIPSGIGFGSNFMLGATDGVNQWALTTRSIYQSGQSFLGGSYNQVIRKNRYRDDACILHIGATEVFSWDTVDQFASIVSLDPDGFTVNLTAAGESSRPSPMTVTYLAIGEIDGNVKVGTGTVGDASLTAGFAPDAMVFASAQRPDGDVSTDMYATVGVTDGRTTRCAWAGSETGPFGGGPSGFGPPCTSYWATDGRILHMDTYRHVPLVVGHATLTATGADLTWPTDDSASRLFGWIAFQVGVDRTRTEAVTDAPIVGAVAATLEGEVVPNTSPGDNVDYLFDWGLTTGYGNTTPRTTDGSGTSTVDVNATITGLTPATTYHYRLVAIRKIGGVDCTSFGADVEFTTLPTHPVFAHAVRIQA